MSLDSLINSNTLSLQQQVTVIDGSGGKSNSYTTIAANVGAFIQDAKAETKRNYLTDNIVVTSMIITFEGRGRANDRWLDSDGVTVYLIKGVHTLRGIGGIETYYVYDAQEKRLS